MNMSNKTQNKDRQEKQRHNQSTPQTRGAVDQQDTRSTNLRDSPMMARLLDAMECGEDVGEYGRLTFVMVGRFFLSNDDLLKYLEKQPNIDEKAARAQIAQVKERGYNPPKRERILQWSERQDFQLCPDPEDPTGCNVYRELQFPDEIYAQIEDYWEEKSNP
jgi:hypothetical protein